MSKKKAVQYYSQKYNCAQSILKAFGNSDELVNECAKCGGGRAKDGLCGALYAGTLLLEDPQEQEELKAYFVKKATSTKCREVRKAKVLTCGKCVERVAKFLEKKSGK
ncbi:MAG: hypothetical protein PVH19_07010 [Planctomycetia bacterium]|jgi:hypothetical protein